MPFAINDGVRIHYEVVGHGEPLVLYHGLTGSGERWRDTGYVAGLENGHRLILIDARGHGQSDKPHDPAAYGRRRQAADVIAVLDDLGIPTTRSLAVAQERDAALKQLADAQKELEEIEGRHEAKLDELRDYYETKLDDERQRSREELERLLREIAELRYEIGKLESDKTLRKRNDHQD